MSGMLLCTNSTIFHRLSLLIPSEYMNMLNDICQRTKRQLRFTEEHSGPEHDKTFTVKVFSKTKGVPGIEAVTRGRGGGWVSEGLKIFSSGPSKIYF